MATEHIHGGNVEEIKREYGLKEEELIDFSANINFLGPPPSAFTVISSQLEKMDRYPTRNSQDVKPYLAQYLKVNSDKIIIGNGGAELIYGLVKALKPQRVLIPQPSFSEYELAVKSLGGEIETLQLKEENEFQLPVDRFIERLKGVELVFLCNPHNPTGQLLPIQVLIKILQAARTAGVIVAVDEAFIDFISRNENYSLRGKLNAFNNLFILGSLTKFFAIPGLRLGYGLSANRVVKRIEMFRDPWSVNIFAQKVAKEIVREKDYITATINRIGEERNFLYQKLQELEGIKVYNSRANFFLCRVQAEKWTASGLREKLLQKGIIIRDCSSFTGLDDNYFRVAVRSREENNKLLANLKQILSAGD